MRPDARSLVGTWLVRGRPGDQSGRDGLPGRCGSVQLAEQTPVDASGGLEALRLGGVLECDRQRDNRVLDDVLVGELVVTELGLELA